jgi:hypothetical protein
LKRFFKVPNARSTVVLSCEWRRLNNSFGFSGSLVPLYSLRWYRVERNGGSTPGLAAYPASARKYLPTLLFCANLLANN